MKSIKKSIIAAIAAAALVVTALVGGSPANAVYGNSAINRSNGYVLVQLDSGQQVYLGGYGAKANNVFAVLVQPGTCVSVKGAIRCNTRTSGNQPYYLHLGQYEVKRIS